MQNTIYKAHWILPVSSPPIENGALLVENGHIKAIGSTSQILALKESGTQVLDYEEAAIIPAWVNAHAHLELSVFHNSIKNFTHFVDWIGQLITLRQMKPAHEIITSAKEAGKTLRSSGCALVGDITNGDLLPALELPAGLERVVFYEVLGFQQKKAADIFDQAMQKMKQENPRALLAPHAPYSTSIPLIQKIAAVSKPLTIHLAESPEESRLLSNGAGPFKDFLQKRAVWDEGWRIPETSPVAYLNRHGLLNRNSLLVHGVRVNDADVEIIKNSGATVCVCPRSNAMTGVGKAPLEKYLQNDIPVCLGTDSLASNIDLDMNNEIYYAGQNYAGISAKSLLKMATLNGAGILGRANELGSLQPGKKARLNIFMSKDTINNNPEEFIISKSWSEKRCL